MSLRLSKPEHLIIRVSLGFLYAFLLLAIEALFLFIVTQLLRIIKKTRVFLFTGANSSLLGADSKQPLGADS